jgi:Outer membrane protein beta-barrel domain
MKTFFLCCLLAFGTAVVAQDDTPEKHKMQEKSGKHGKHGMYGKYGQFMPQSILGIGASFQKFDALNGRVAGFSEYEPLKDAMGTLQLGWLKERKRFVSGSDIGIGSSMSGDKGKKSSNIRYIGVGADFGYDLIKSDRILLYPYAGIGYEWYQARFYKDNSGVDFDDVLDSPNLQNSIRPVNFKNDYFTYRVGLGFQVKSPKNMGSGIGLKAGYTGSFSDREWKSNDNQNLANAPKDGLSRFSVSLVFSHQPMMMGH